METGILVLIAVLAVVIIAGGIAIALRPSLLPIRRTDRLKKRFGAEYDHAVDAHGDASAAERDLSERLRRREDMDIRELTERERVTHTDAWATVRQEFVDAPERAVHDARRVVEAIMADRGYPGHPVDDDFEQGAKDLSVDHPGAVTDFRRRRTTAHLAEAEQGRGHTEHLRETLVAYRGLVETLLGRLPETSGTGRHARTEQPENGSEASR